MGIFAAHFQLEFLQAGGALQGNAVAHGLRAGEADRVNAGVGYQRVANNAATTHHQVEDTGGNAAAADDFGQRPGATRHQIGRFEHHAIAIGQGRCNFPSRNGDGEIPGCDDANHAERLACDFHAYAGAHRGQGLACQTQTFTGKELEDIACARRFANTFGLGLAFFAGQERAQFFAPRQDLGADLVQRIGTRLDARDGPSCKRRARRLHGAVQLCCAGLGVVPLHIGSVGRVDVGREGRTRHPFAIDQVVVFLCHSVLCKNQCG